MQKSKPQRNMVSIFFLAKFISSTVPPRCHHPCPMQVVQQCDAPKAASTGGCVTGGRAKWVRACNDEIHRLRMVA